MPPRRVLPIRSRVDNPPFQERAGGDVASKSPDQGLRSANSAGGASVGVNSAPGQNHAPETHKKTPVNESKADKKGTESADTNGATNFQTASTKDNQALPKNGVGMKEAKEDILRAIINGNQVSVKIKLNTKKSEAVSEKKGPEASATISGTRPKRKRNNLYSSLSPSVMNATVEERAKNYAEAPQRLHKQAKGMSYPNHQVDLKDIHPSVLDAESAVQASGGKVPQEYLGEDGNLFYCRICLGVGEVVCCDNCPQVFHPACIPDGPSKSSLDNDDDPWYCPECVGKGMLGESIKQKSKRRKTNAEHEDAEMMDESPASPPRRVKKRCGTCNKKAVGNFPLVECSKQGCAALMHFPGCPDRLQGDDNAFVDSKFGPLCPSCTELIRSKSRGKRKSEDKEKAGRGSSRGGGKGGRGGKSGKVQASTGGKRTIDQQPHPKELFLQPELESSGYQAPYIEDADEDVGPQSLAYVEKPTGSIPAFFFFLVNNRNAIERSLQKKNRAFRSMPKSVARNELVAEQGAIIWLGLTDREKRAWIDLSVNDFQDRVVAWKEKEIIEAMMQVDGVEKGKEQHATETRLFTVEDEKHAISFRQRTLQFSRVKTVPMKPSKARINNSVLLELLNDGRFHPVQLVGANRSEKDSLTHRQGERAVEQFSVQGPIQTSIGDECMGCARGWRHYCHVLKQTIPRSAARASLQPPSGSTSATRIGLGLKTSSCEMLYLQDPSLRRDDVTVFMEDAMAVTTIMPNLDEHTYKASAIPEMDSSSETTKTRKRPSDKDNSMNEDGAEKRRYKCGRCLIVQYSPFGCIRCRRDQLLRETSGREPISASYISSDFLHGSSALSNSHNYDEGFLKPKCVMLKHDASDEIDNNTDSRRDDQLTKDNWAPNAILPPEPKHSQKEKANDPHSDSEISSDFDDSSLASDSSHSSRGVNSSPGARETKCSEHPVAITSSGSQDKAHDLRKSRQNVADSQSSANRQLAATKHKETADELSRKCLSIACSGILVGMIRRDPLRLFAKPAPASMEEYHKVIKNPVDFQTMRKKLLANEYATLGSFISDAKRLCINACVFNAADSLYAITAKQIYDSLLVMVKRAQQWITILKNTHASSLHDDSDDGSTCDIFKNVESMWPGAVELLNSGSWLEREAQADFVRTRENEMAYYGALALRRAATAASESCSSKIEEKHIHRPVVRRSHIEDEMLREAVKHSVSQLDGPACLTDQPEWREEQLLKLLKILQNQRVDLRSSSESGCTRCDTMKSEKDRSEATSILRNNAKTALEDVKVRVDNSRAFQSTGLASRNARNATAAEDSNVLIGPVANEMMLGVKGSGIHGWGLYADCNFKQGDIVAEYIGEYISNAVADVREQYYRKQRIQDYQFRVNEKVIIDATLKGGYARYINHSCQPNCVARILEGEPPNPHLMRVMIIAKKDIEAGVELTYDYHFPLETDLDNRVPCNYGSKHCRGYMNWDIPEKIKNWKVNRKIERKGRVNSKKS